MANNVNDTRPSNRGARITVRFSEDEAARVRAWSDKRDLSPSAVLRLAALDVVDGHKSLEMPQQSTQESETTVDAAEAAANAQQVRELHVEMRRIGNNVNQIAHVLNSCKWHNFASKVSAEDVREAIEMSGQAVEIFREIKKMQMEASLSKGLQGKRQP